MDLCRAGDWKGGFVELSRVQDLRGDLDVVPAVVESFLGHSIALLREGGYEDGLRRCQEAAAREVWEPETHLNLALTYLLRRNKRSAILSLDRGLEIDSSHRKLVSTRKKFGFRRGLVFPFLERGHFLNRTFGALRHKVLVRREPGQGLV